MPAKIVAEPPQPAKKPPEPPPPKEEEPKEEVPAKVVEETKSESGSDKGTSAKSKMNEKALARAQKLAGRNRVFSTIRVCKGVEASTEEASDERAMVDELAAQAMAMKKTKIQSRKTNLGGKTVYTMMTELEDRKKTGMIDPDTGEDEDARAVYDPTIVTGLPPCHCHSGLCPILRRIDGVPSNESCPLADVLCCAMLPSCIG